MCEDCFAAIITEVSIFWTEHLLFEPPRYGGSFFVVWLSSREVRRQFNCVRRSQWLPQKRRVRVAPEAQAIFCRHRRAKARRPPTAAT